MGFPKKISQTINDYVERHIGDDDFYRDYFWIINDAELRLQLEQEFRSARYIYKLLEGMQATEWLKNAEVRVQILQYASIYEAILHHVLLTHYANTDAVKAITMYMHNQPVNISGAWQTKIVAQYNVVGDLKVYETQPRPVDPRKITFEAKADAALELNLIDRKVHAVIVEIYSLPNAIHLHAELRRGVTYDLQKSREAYRKVQGLRDQVGKKLVADGILQAPPVQPNRRPVKRSGWSAWRAWLTRLAARLKPRSTASE